MIVILCESFKDAKEAFDIWLRILSWENPRSIRTIYKNSCCVETDDDLRYIFVDQRMRSVFDKMRPDILTAEKFFDGVMDIYEEYRYEVAPFI